MLASEIIYAPPSEPHRASLCAAKDAPPLPQASPASDMHCSEGMSLGRDFRAATAMYGSGGPVAAPESGPIAGATGFPVHGAYEPRAGCRTLAPN
jgi:hypothetical protein